MFGSHSRKSLQRAARAAERTMSMRTVSLAVGAALSTGLGHVALAQSRWTPADNDGIAAIQGALTGAHIGATIGGVLAETLGPQDGLMVMGTICLISTLAVMVLVPTIRRID